MLIVRPTSVNLRMTLRLCNPARFALFLSVTMRAGILLVPIARCIELCSARTLMLVSYMCQEQDVGLFLVCAFVATRDPYLTTHRFSHGLIKIGVGNPVADLEENCI